MKNGIDINEISNAIQEPRLVKAEELQGGHPEMNGLRPVMYTGGFCAVFPFNAKGRKYAVRCWHTMSPVMDDLAKAVSSALQASSLPYFVPYRYCKDGIATSQGVIPLIIMDWVDAAPLKLWLKKHIHNSSAIRKLADAFLKMTTDLHKSGIAHGDLQHGNILVQADGSIKLVDYDSMCVPGIEGRPLGLFGLEGYQHPARSRLRKLSPKMDYFSELVIYTSLLALAERPSLWKELKIEGTETLVFSAEDILSGGKAPIFSKLSRMAALNNLIAEMKAELSRQDIEQLRPLEAIVGKPAGTPAPSPSPWPHPTPAPHKPAVQGGDWLDKLRSNWKTKSFQQTAGYNPKDVVNLRQKWTR